MSRPNFVRYRPVVSVIDRKAAGGSYSWGAYLEKVLDNLDGADDNDAYCKPYVVPAEVFYQAPFAEYLKYIGTNVKIEVALHDDKYDRGTLKLYWFARVVKVAGYRLLLRFEGMDRPEDRVHDFWVNIGSTDIRPVGYCSEEPETRGLVPPEAIYERKTDWKQYILCQIHAYKTIAFNWPEIQVQKLSYCKFKKGDRLELLDSTVSARVRPACVEEVIGTRMLVRVNPKMLSEAAEEDDIQVNEGVWMDEDSPLIFPVGWAHTVGYQLEADDEYTKHAKEVADALKSGSTNIPYGKHDAEHSIFKTYIEVEAKEDSVGWEEGMKLEVLDPLDTWKELRVATVLEIMDDGYLKVGVFARSVGEPEIGFDGEEMEEDPVPLHCTSELLFPVGYAKKYGVRLKGPKDTGAFDWDAYLEQCEGRAAPEELFSPFSNDVLSNFKIGAKLEAADMCEPHLICAATVAAHRGRLLQIEYDGWDNSYDQLFDYRSPNIFPLGWCEMHGYKLEAPKVAVVKKKRRRKQKEVKDQVEESA